MSEHTETPDTPTVTTARTRLADARQALAALMTRTAAGDVTARELNDARAEVELSELALTGAKDAAEQQATDDRATALEAELADAAAEFSELQRKLDNAIEDATAVLRGLIAIGLDYGRLRAQCLDLGSRLGRRPAGELSGNSNFAAHHALCAAIWPAIKDGNRLALARQQLGGGVGRVAVQSWPEARAFSVSLINHLTD